MQTRREFLTTGIKGAGLLAATGFVPSFLTRTAMAAGAERQANVLVVVQLSGGNDGLNTVIPYTDDLYFKARPSIALRGAEVLKIDDRAGLHPGMSALKKEFDEGRVAVVQNVGYPNPDRSHFRSMEIWHTGAGPEDRRQVTGWLGRYFDAQCSGADPHANNGNLGMSFGKVMPQAFRNISNVGIALDNPDTFRWNASGETSALAKMQEEIFSKLNSPGGAVMFDKLAMMGGITGQEPETLEFLRHTAMNATLSGETIRGILRQHRNPETYPNSRLGEELAMVSKLIAGDFPARVYYVSQGGFDTHSGQAGAHARLLSDLAESTAAFLRDLRKTKHSQRVMLLAFSEFGRRVEENGSAGTDHGAAAPVFVIGDHAKGGLQGDAPDLADLTDGDLKHKTDFREVYASLLDDWLVTPSEAILGRKFAKAPVLAKATRA